MFVANGGIFIGKPNNDEIAYEQMPTF